MHTDAAGIRPVSLRTPGLRLTLMPVGHRFIYLPCGREIDEREESGNPR